jgi:UDP-N-acetylglucosamine:LPS N-acetylglucosamine transferase
LTPSWLADYLANMAAQPERLERMSIAMKKRAQPAAARSLATLLEEVVLGESAPQEQGKEDGGE